MLRHDLLSVSGSATLSSGAWVTAGPPGARVLARGRCAGPAWKPSFQHPEPRPGQFQGLTSLSVSHPVRPGNQPHAGPTLPPCTPRRRPSSALVPALSQPPPQPGAVIQPVYRTLRQRPDGTAVIKQLKITAGRKAPHVARTLQQQTHTQQPWPRGQGTTPTVSFPFAGELRSPQGPRGCQPSVAEARAALAPPATGPSTGPPSLPLSAPGTGPFSSHLHTSSPQAGARGRAPTVA